MLMTAMGLQSKGAWTGLGRAKWLQLMFLGCLGLFPSCASSSLGAISVEALPEDPVVARAEYTIGVGDTLSVQVFDQDRMSGRARVRPDGRITVGFFVNDIDAEGKTPRKLADDVAAILQPLLTNPAQVTVLVEDSSPQSILILGEVGRPGMAVLPRDAGVALALATAGGLTAFAKKDRIFVNRPGPPIQKIQFSYKNLIQMTGRAPSFRLRPKDVIVVE